MHPIQFPNVNKKFLPAAKPTGLVEANSSFFFFLPAAKLRRSMAPVWYTF